MPKIMLVEDDNNLREIYGERLMAEGYEIISAGDGEEALALAVKEKPDLIISDVMMPKISGFDMLDILRQTPETKYTKVIMMTALSQNDDKDRATKLGADKYLVKSQVTLEDVARVVHDMIYEDQTPVDATESITEESANNSASPEQIAVVEPVVLQQAPAAEPSLQAVEMQIPPSEGEMKVPEDVNTEVPQPITEPVPTNSPVANIAESDSSPIAQPEAPSPITEPAPAASKPEAIVSPVAEAVVKSQPPAAENNVADTKVNPPTSEPAFDLVANSVQQTEASPTVNPITGEATDSQPASQTDLNSSALPQSMESEIDAIAKQINNFENTVKESPMEHSAPAITPTEQEVIHAQNKAEDPTVVQPAVSSGVDLSNSTVPPVVDTANPESASARKKVISPISDGTEAQPSIYDLYEKEMAEEAANSPVKNPETGTVLESGKQPVEESQNPITTSTDTIADSVPQLETLDTTLVTGITFDDQNPATPAVPESPLQQNTPPNNVNQATKQAASQPQKPLDPNDPANFAL